MSFRRVWSRFCASPTTLGPSPGAREAWHQGRRWYHVTLLTLHDPAVIARRDAVLDALVDAVSPFAVQDPHVTLFVHGFADPAEVRPLPFEDALVPLAVGGVNAFRSCVFLEVRAPELAVLRSQLSGQEERWAAYRPHLTVGLFRASAPVSSVLPRLRVLRNLPPLRCSGRATTVFVDALDPSLVVRRMSELI